MTPLHTIGWPTDLPTAWSAALVAHPPARPARVIAQHRSGYIVAEGPGEGYATQSPPDWQRTPGYRKGALPSEERAAVGDWVLVEGTLVKGTAAKSQIVALLPRHSAIKRAAAGEHYKQQVIAANIDTVFVVCGLDGDFNPRRIERYLLLVQGSGCTPVVVLTKADTVDDPAESIATVRASVGDAVAIVALNARDPRDAAVLAPWLGPGRTAVLVGSSGAGKSTLTNSLLGIERMKTAAVRENDARGRHTTTHRALLPLPGGACLIDTPGMRELKPTGEETVAENFADIEALAAQCKFRDCRHEREPGCAVRAAIEAGVLDPARFAHYRKLDEEVAAAADKLANRQAAAAVSTRGNGPGKRPEPKNGRR
jgi:ribosome biogenesis GTPase